MISDFLASSLRGSRGQFSMAKIQDSTGECMCTCMCVCVCSKDSYSLVVKIVKGRKTKTVQ